MMASVEIEGIMGGHVRVSIDTEDPTGDDGRVYVQTKADGDRASWGPMIAVHPTELRTALNGLLYTDRADRRWVNSSGPKQENLEPVVDG